MNSHRIGDRLAALRRARFVGRGAELELFRSALRAAEPPFAVLHVYGPGGVGKTALLREYARLAAESGRPVVQLDGRNVDPSPPGFLRGLRLDGGPDDAELPTDVRAWPPAAVLLIDTYETLAPLDPWLREHFLPRLPAGSLVVIAGRNPPAQAWRTDAGWAELARSLPLGNLRPAESRTYLAARGVPADQLAGALAFTRGHPLALALVADVLRRGDGPAAFDPAGAPDVVRALLERLVHDEPSLERRTALEVCVLAWATTEATLAAVLDVADAHPLFEWLRGLSFIEHGPYGLFPHDVARAVLYADLRWRNAANAERLIERLTAHLYARLEQAHGVEQQRTWFHLFNLYRHNPFFADYFDWDALGSAYAEAAAPGDHAAILEMVQQHEGEASAQIAQHWLRRQPAAFLVFRTLDGTPFGFMAQLALHQATAEDAALDPALPAALRFVERHGPLRPGAEIVYLRFWMSRDAYQGVSPALNLAAINSTIYWTTHPRLAWNFIPAADPAFHEAHFTSIHIRRAPEADFELEGRRYGVFAHDWRVEPAAAWLNMKAALAAPVAPGPPAPQATPAAPAPLLLLAEAEFAAAVRGALRDYAHPERLAGSPLLRTRLLAGAPGHAGDPAALQALLRDAAATLTADARSLKFHRAVWHTYFEPAPTQERAAELLGLPFNTYRYQLANGIERIAAWLWQRELAAGGG